MLLLAALWGGSFFFMRASSADFGPAGFMFVRTALAAICLSPFFLSRRNFIFLIKRAPALSFIGLFGTALPFCLLSYAALTLSAGITGVLNSTTPFFTLLVALVWMGQKTTLLQVIGIFLGLLGVGMMSAENFAANPQGVILAVLAGLGAALNYGVSTNFIKHYMQDIPSRVLASGSMLFAALWLLPFAIWLWPAEKIPVDAWVNVSLLAILSTAIAYLIFYDLVARVSAVAATSVIFVVPAFATFWGWLFLSEKLSWLMLSGMTLSLIGTSMTIGLWQRKRGRERCNAAGPRASKP
ncbi:MAG: DMT family transporter [Chthoniobacterales bacterium]